MRLVQFARRGTGEMLMRWDDGHEGPVSLRSLRDHCPCANCRGETMLLRTYTPPPADTSTPGRYDLKGAVPVGNYALQMTWGDGHNEGIYTWELLRSLCECEECSVTRKGEGGGVR